jgi:hypothetical protein
MGSRGFGLVCAARQGTDDADTVCCICLDGFEKKALFITECGHKYHFNCIKKYCEKGKDVTSNCPVSELSTFSLAVQMCV